MPSLVLRTPRPWLVPSGISSGWHAPALPEDRLPAPASRACASPKSRTPGPAGLRPPRRRPGPGVPAARSLIACMHAPAWCPCSCARFVFGSAVARAGPGKSRPTREAAGHPAGRQRCLACVLARPQPRQAPAGPPVHPWLAGKTIPGPAGPASTASARGIPIPRFRKSHRGFCPVSAASQCHQKRRSERKIGRNRPMQAMSVFRFRQRRRSIGQHQKPATGSGRLPCRGSTVPRAGSAVWEEAASIPGRPVCLCQRPAIWKTGRK